MNIDRACAFLSICDSVLVNQSMCAHVINKMNSILVLLICCTLHGVIGAYKILGIYPVPSKSHYFVGQALLEGLAEDGHEITIISPFITKTPSTNYTQIFLENSYKNFIEGNFHALQCLCIPQKIISNTLIVEWIIEHFNLGSL